MCVYVKQYLTIKYELSSKDERLVTSVVIPSCRSMYK